MIRRVQNKFEGDVKLDKQVDKREKEVNWEENKECE